MNEKMDGDTKAVLIGFLALLFVLGALGMYALQSNHERTSAFEKAMFERGCVRDAGEGTYQRWRCP